jgi:hypothetical protein
LNLAIFVQVVGYLSFCVAYQCFSPCFRGAKGDTRPTSNGQEIEPGRQELSAYLIAPFAVIGLVGLYLSHDGISGYLEYLTSPAVHRLRNEEPSTPAMAAGAFLKHFFGFAVVLAWSCWLAQRGHERKTFSLPFGLLFGTALVVVLLLAANFSYNRGAMLGPLVALAAAFSLHVWRIPFKGVALAAGVTLSLALMFGAYRSSNLEISELSNAASTRQIDTETIVDFVQIYASGPQLSAFLFEHLELEGKQFHGATLLPSIVYPVPVLGKPYRDLSGTVIFNDLIYGYPDNLDQVIPLNGELYINFQLAGVIVGNVLLAAVIAGMQFKFRTSRTPVESYAWFTLALWTIFPGSLPVISQMYLYSFWPIYVFFAVASCQLPVVRQLTVVSPSSVVTQPPAVNRQLSTDNCQLTTVN